MKRGVADGDAIAPAAKRVHTAEVEEALKELKEHQVHLDKVDDECAVKQMEIQRTYDEQKRPLFAKRKAIIAKIPNFWGQAVCKYPHVRQMVCPEDVEIFSHLVDIELEDNLDQHGSYKLAFIFDDGVKEFFEPTRLEKYISFAEKDDVGKETLTEITWKEGKRPVAELPSRSKLMESDEDEEGDSAKEDDDDETLYPSMIEWFSTESINTMHESFGEIIRRSVFHQPIPCFEASSDSEDEDDDEDDDDEVDGDGKPTA